MRHVKQEKKTNFHCATLANNGILAILSDIGQILSKIFKYRQIRSDYKDRQKTAKYLIWPDQIRIQTWNPSGAQACFKIPIKQQNQKSLCILIFGESVSFSIISSCKKDDSRNINLSYYYYYFFVSSSDLTIFLISRLSYILEAKLNSIPWIHYLLNQNSRTTKAFQY